MSALPAVRLVASDLDGTLLRTDGDVSERTRRVLTRIQSAGIVVVLVSARPPRTLRIMARQVGATGLAICCNGAIVYDLACDQIARHWPMATEAARWLIGELRDAAPGVCFAFELGTRFGCEPAFAALRPSTRDPIPLQDDALALCTEPVTKLIAHHAELSIDGLLEIARRCAGDIAIVTHSGAGFVEIAAAGVHKARALASLCAEQGIAAGAVIAFGDMPNDLPMLRWAGHGVAVANAHPDVLEMADEITLANDADGVAVILERLVADGLRARAVSEV